MTDLISPISSEDVAWVRISTPLLVEELREFCRDLERLYRINPMLEFTEWRKIGYNHYFFQANNLSNGLEIATEIHLEETEKGFKITYNEGLKSATFINIEANSKESFLVIIDDYSKLPVAERTQRLAEVDHSLEQWGQELHRYLKNWQRYSWFPPFRWYMRQWQSMKPMGRRIAYMLIVITLFELVAIIAIFGI
ncbi:MAG: hypothetical protein KAI83_08560 [Thiomargarita sp.]|nr:hypothetical protein [Thiomargarita sp.]